MLLIEELLQRKKAAEEKANFRNEILAKQNMMIAEEIYNKGKEGLLESTNQGKIGYDINIVCEKKAREGEIQWTRSHYDAVPLIAQIAINDGVNFTYKSSSSDFENCRYCFGIEKYKKNYMSKLFKGGKKEKYFKYEATLYQELKEIDTVDNAQLICERTISSINEKNKELYYDAFNNALYRLGFDDIEPTYTKYCKINYCDLKFQAVHNCTEILHNINKEKHLNLDENKQYKK